MLRSPDAPSHRNRRLAAAGERRRAHTRSALTSSARPWCNGVLCDAGRISVVPGSDLSGSALRLAEPDAIHIATEGTIGHAVRAYCLRERRPFTTSYMTRFPEYVSARVPIPECWSYALLRRFHSAATVTMVSTSSLMAELTERRFRNIGLWTRGVDTDLFKPAPAADLDLPRPIFMSVGRIAVEKNLEAFLSLPLPGSKVVIGSGPQEAELRQRFPEATFLGLLEGADLAAHMAAAD